MILHVLRFRFNDGVSEADLAACVAALREVGRADSVSFSTVGDYLGASSEGYTHSAVYALTDLPAFERFMHEPAHRRAEFVVFPNVNDFAVFDIGDGEGSDLSSKTADIWRRRLADDPELAKLMEEQWN
jgi:hypothetical protein